MNNDAINNSEAAAPEQRSLDARTHSAVQGMTTRACGRGGPAAITYRAVPVEMGRRSRFASGKFVVIAGFIALQQAAAKQQL